MLDSCGTAGNLAVRPFAHLWGLVRKTSSPSRRFSTVQCSHAARSTRQLRLPVFRIGAEQERQVGKGLTAFGLSKQHRRHSHLSHCPTNRPLALRFLSDAPIRFKQHRRRQVDQARRRRIPCSRVSLQQLCRTARIPVGVCRRRAQAHLTRPPPESQIGSTSGSWSHQPFKRQRGRDKAEPPVRPHRRIGRRRAWKLSPVVLPAKPLAPGCRHPTVRRDNSRRQFRHVETSAAGARRNRPAPGPFPSCRCADRRAFRRRDNGDLRRQSSVNRSSIGHDQPIVVPRGKTFAG